MSLATSDFNGKAGQGFTLILSAGKIQRASLHIVGQQDTTIAVSGGDLQVTVPALPANDSLIQLIMKPWLPGEPNATVSLAPGSSMAVTSQNPWINDGSIFGFVNLFGI